MIIVDPKTAEQIFNRLTRVEKMQMLSKSAGGIDHDRQTIFGCDGNPSEETFNQVIKMVDAEFNVRSAQLYF